MSFSGKIRKSPKGKSEKIEILLEKVKGREGYLFSKYFSILHQRYRLHQNHDTTPDILVFICSTFPFDLLSNSNHVAKFLVVV